MLAKRNEHVKSRVVSSIYIPSRDHSVDGTISDLVTSPNIRQKFVQRGTLVPAEGVLSHDGRADLLCAYTATLAVATSKTAPAARRDASITSSMHPSSGTARDGSVSHAAASAGDRAGALVCHALVPVTTSNEEHGSTVSDSANNSSSGNTGSRSVDRSAGALITSHGTSISGSS